MKKLSFLILIIFFSLSITSSFALTNSPEFVTPRDLLSSEPISNINLQNNRNSPVTIYGLYVRQYAYLLPGQSCDNATVIYPATNNITAGAFVSPITIPSGKKAVIGGNYLYNMIYAAIYYENIIIPSSPPGCALPGCTWGSDTTKYNWCIYLGALAPVSTSTGYTSSVPPAMDAASNAGVYDYNLISNYVSIGPISCDDKSLACQVATQQTQSFS